MNAHITVAPFSGAVVVDDAGTEIGIQTGDGVTPFMDAASAERVGPADEAATPPQAWPVDEHDPLGVFAPPGENQLYALESMDPRNPPDIAAIQEAQTLFRALELDNVLANHAWRAAQMVALKPLSDAEAQLAFNRAQAVLDQRYGVEGAKVLKGRAIAEVERVAVKHPEILEMLIETGLGNDVWFIERLAQKGEVRAARKQATNPSPIAGASLTVEQAQHQLAQRMADPTYTKRYLEGDAEVANELHGLQRTIASGAT